jgi:hypothetical protein
MEYLPLFSWKGRSYGSKIVISAFFTAFSTPDHFTLLGAATLLAAGAMLGFSTVRGGALRASVAPTEAAKDVVARSGVIDRSSREVTSRVHASLYACHHLLVNVYRSQLLRCRRTEARKR